MALGPRRGESSRQIEHTFHHPLSPQLLYQLNLMILRYGRVGTSDYDHGSHCRPSSPRTIQDAGSELRRCLAGVHGRIPVQRFSPRHGSPVQDGTAVSHGSSPARGRIVVDLPSGGDGIRTAGVSQAPTADPAGVSRSLRPIASESTPPDLQCRPAPIERRAGPVDPTRWKVPRAVSSRGGSRRFRDL